jgi:hypothetical protein
VQGANVILELRIEFQETIEHRCLAIEVRLGKSLARYRFGAMLQ